MSDAVRRYGAQIRLAVLGVVAVAALAGLMYAWREMQRTPRNPDYGRVPEFALLDARGDTLRAADLDDKVWAVDFMFTRCKGICPVLAQRMLALQEGLEEEPGWALVSITVDPEHDRPPVLAAYADSIGADPDRWHFLTGDPATLTDTVREGFLMPIARQDSEVEPILHSPRIILVNRGGAIRGIYDADNPAEMEALREDALHLLRDGAS